MNVNDSQETVLQPKTEASGRRQRWPTARPSGRMRNPDECAHSDYDPSRHGGHCPSCGDYMGL